MQKNEDRKRKERVGRRGGSSPIFECKGKGGTESTSNQSTHRPPLVVELLAPVHAGNFGIELVERLDDHERLLSLDLGDAVDLAPRHQHVLVVQLPLAVPVRTRRELLVLGGERVGLLELVLLSVLESNKGRGLDRRFQVDTF